MTNNKNNNDNDNLSETRSENNAEADTSSKNNTVSAQSAESASFNSVHSKEEVITQQSKDSAKKPQPPIAKEQRVETRSAEKMAQLKTAKRQKIRKKQHAHHPSFQSNFKPASKDQPATKPKANSFNDSPKTVLHLIIDLFSLIGRLFSSVIKKYESAEESFQKVATQGGHINSNSQANVSDDNSSLQGSSKNSQSTESDSKVNKRHLVTAASILGTGLVIGWLLIALAPEADIQPIKQRIPLIQAVKVSQVAKRIPIFSRGTVEPRTQLNLISEVEGHVTYISENLESGRAFKKDELLMSIDPARYELEMTKKQSAVASAKLHLQKTTATAKVARKGAKRKASAYALHIPQLNEAKAKLAAAEADLEVAKLRLANTQIKAPFTGRVKTSDINTGQYINGGALIAAIYALDIAEIRLPISNKQIKLIDLPWFYSEDATLEKVSLNEEVAPSDLAITTTEENEEAPKQIVDNLPYLKIIGRFGGSEFSWDGQIKHAEGGLDENQLMYLVGQIEKPYQWDVANPDRPPLEPGLFVEAEIEGKYYDSIFEVPRQALHGNNKVWLVNNKNQLQVKEVNVIYRGPDSAYINEGLEDGQRLVITALDYVVNGMEVRVSEIYKVPSKTPAEEPSRVPSKNKVQDTPKRVAQKNPKLASSQK